MDPYASLYHNHNMIKSIDVSIYLIGTHQKKIYTKGFDPRNTLHSYLLTIWSVWKININQWKYCLYVFESMVIHFLRTGSCCMIPVSNLYFEWLNKILNLKFWIINLVFRFSNEMNSTCSALSIGMQIKSYHKYIYDIVKTYNIYVRNFLTIGFNIQLYSIIFFNFENEKTPSSPFKPKILSRKRKTFKNNPIFVILIYIWTGTFF